MAATKKESALEYFRTVYDGNNIEYRENSVTLSNDFIINTGTAKILVKIFHKRWDDSDSISIVDFLKSKEQKILNALSDNEDAIVSIK